MTVRPGRRTLPSPTSYFYFINAPIENQLKAEKETRKKRKGKPPAGWFLNIRPATPPGVGLLLCFLSSSHRLKQQSSVALQRSHQDTAQNSYCQNLPNSHSNHHIENQIL